MNSLQEWIKRYSSNILLGFSILFALLLGEMAIRICGHVDIDGNFYVKTLECYPYHMPIKTLQNQVNKYLAGKGKSNWTYDRDLGWAPKSRAESKKGLFSYNEDAIRTFSGNTIISKLPSPGVLRILIFGDSFTHGNEVSFLNTWGHYLEDDLKKKNINAEVLNFGVGGYGMDQAFLRWKQQGYRYKPSIVIFGLQLENMNRNVNLIRQFYSPKELNIFAKPRFVLENGKLALINEPTPDPQELVDLMRDFDSWKWAKDEYWYHPEDYKDNVLFRSRLIAFVYTWFKDQYKKRSIDEGELEDLSLKIISSFKEDVESAGGKFYLVYLPLRDDVNLVKETKEMPRSSFFIKLEKITPVIHTEDQLSRATGDLKELIPAHYSAKANKIVADVIADSIIEK